MEKPSTPQSSAPPLGGILSRLRDAVILLAAGGLTWTDSGERGGRY
jgi:hypothetical protein